MGILSKLFGDANQRAIDQLRSLVTEINALEPQFERFSLAELRAKTVELKKLVVKSGSLDIALAEAFAAVREAAKRTLGQRHFDVQLVGGMVLHQGKIAEMKTGEGKTLVATLPAYLNALTGRGVHIVTVNDYLSRRDGVWMGQIYNALGLSVGVLNHEASYLYDPWHGQNQNSKIKIQNDNAKVKNGEDKLDVERDTTGAFRVIHEFLRPVTRREAYQADITYGTNNEYGFDYLRDNMVYARDQMVQRPEAGHNFAIVDEIDSILIDEARTPLIISAPDMESTQLYETFAKIVPRLSQGEDYNVDEKLRAVSITEAGIEKIEKLLNLKNIYEEGGTRYVHHLEQALKAQILFHRDKDYVVKNGEVIIVDEFTGRLMPGRRWSGGLHQAMEAKEKVLVQKESRTLGTITFQNYFRLYEKLAGMTGTAQTSAEEFHKVYKLDVITVPTNKPMVRHDAPDRIYKSEPGKFLSVAQAVKERHLKGQPVLIGTTSITKNELLAAYLNREGVPHKMLNAKNHEQEGEIIAQAGRLGAVTLATNLAGRGVDIILGGNPVNPEDAEKVRALGGLHVIGTERHEARRIDNQLRGRSGRQGDPGSTQFFISAEDELVRIFGGDRLKNLMERLGVGETEAIENSLVSRSIEQAQSKVEGNNFDIRKYVLEYDDVMNKHRTAIYELRKQFLISNAELLNNPQTPSAKTQILKYLDEVIERLVSFHTAGPDWNREEIEESIKALTGKEFKIDEQISDPEKLKQLLYDLASRSYQEKESQLGADTMRQLEKVILLRVIDELWVDHLEQMEYLRDSVRLRAYGQRDPLIEYKIEGQRLFTELQATIGSQVANLIFKVSATPQPDASRRIKMNAANEKETKSPLVSQKGIGRNAPCPCGSGKKFKKCHGV